MPKDALAPRPRRRETIEKLARAIREDDTPAIEAIVRLSRSRRMFAPLAFTVGAFALLIGGVRLLLTNWRLTLVQILPAMWVWLAMYDLKAHVLHGKSFHVLRGPVLIPVNLAIVAITLAAYFLNAVFAFAISRPGRPEIRPAMGRARSELRTIAAWGVPIGLALGFSTTIATRWQRPAFTLSLSIVTALMMLTYVAVPSRLIGAKRTRSRRDALAVTAIGGAIGATVCTPPYLLGRLGLLMLGGSKALLVPGLILFALGATLQAGATGAVRAVKMSAKLN